MRDNRLVYVILELSDRMSKDLNITLKDIKPINIDNHEIKIPNKTRLKKCVK